MVTTTKNVIETKNSINENLLTPRFYTTNFKEISELDSIITVIILFVTKNF
jgi:hypothetical protein